MRERRAWDFINERGSRIQNGRSEDQTRFQVSGFGFQPRLG